MGWLTSGMSALMHLESSINASPGRREIPTSILRLRRTRTSSLHVLIPKPRISSRRRDPPRPIRRSRGSIAPSIGEGSQEPIQLFSMLLLARMRRISSSTFRNIWEARRATELTYHGRTLSSTKPDHHFLTDLEEKRALFHKAATKYSAKVAA